MDASPYLMRRLRSLDEYLEAKGTNAAAFRRKIADSPGRTHDAVFPDDVPARERPSRNERYRCAGKSGESPDCVLHPKSACG